MIVAVFAASAGAQLPPRPPIGIPSVAPDLVVTMSVPAEIPQTGTALVEITVNNPLTPGRSTPFGQIMSGSDVNGFNVVVRFAGFEPLTIQGDSGFQCGVAGGGGTLPATYAMCTGGVIGAGGVATIKVSVREHGSCETYCGPVYVDAFVDQGNDIAERSETNNRALGVADVINCIN
jgi:hypothetical protein